MYLGRFVPITKEVIMKTLVGHTKGPWLTDGLAIVAQNDFAAEICVLSYDEDNGQEIHVSRLNADCNSHLIAASPALLEAAEHSAQSSHHPVCSWPQDQIKACTCHVGKARAAIAKAKGES